MYSIDDLAHHFSLLGISAGETVMVHASVRSVGELAGGPDSIHLALKSALTSDGTLMMYAGCPRYYDEVGRGHLPSEVELELRQKLPAFDALTARSDRDNGSLVELLRTWPGSHVNHHVARFVVWGKQADYLLSRQPWNYGYGVGSPLERFLMLNGKILLLGSDHDAVTFLHYVEHVTEMTDKCIARYQVPIVEHGRQVRRSMEEVDTSNYAHANWPDRFFAKIVDTFLEKTGNVGGRVGDAMTFVLNARELFNFAQHVMKGVASDRRMADSLTERFKSRVRQGPPTQSITEPHRCRRVSLLRDIYTGSNQLADGYQGTRFP